MERIKSWLENEAIAMYLAMQLVISALGFIFGLIVPAKRKGIAFIPAILVFVAGAVELAAYTLKKLRE